MTPRTVITLLRLLENCCFSRALVTAMLLLVLVPSAFATPPALYETTTLRGASADGQIHVPLRYDPVRNRYRSDDVAPVAIGPIALKAGDVIDIRLSMQYVNPNYSAKGAWTVGASQSEHWSLWVAGADGVRINDRLSWDNSDWAIPQQESNFDNYLHYRDVNRAQYYRVDRDRPTAYIFPRTYFIASSSYCCQPGFNEMLLPGDGYQKLQVAVYR